jgi:hypothetical protein
MSKNKLCYEQNIKYIYSQVNGLWTEHKIHLFTSKWSSNGAFMNWQNFLTIK